MMSVIKRAESCSKLAPFICQINEKCLMTKEECYKINKAESPTNFALRAVFFREALCAQIPRAQK
jgi:hypothetical protein